MIRILIFPFVLFYLVIIAFSHAVIWLLDQTYDHDAAIKAAAENTGWLDSSRFFPSRHRGAREADK
jgi:hypothetical protein